MKQPPLRRRRRPWLAVANITTLKRSHTAGDWTPRHTHTCYFVLIFCVCVISQTHCMFFFSFFLSQNRKVFCCHPINYQQTYSYTTHTHTHSPGISLKILIFFSLSLSVSLSFLLLQISLSGKSYTRRSLLVAYTCFTAYNIPVLDNLMPIAGAIINNGQRQNNNNNEKRS